MCVPSLSTESDDSDIPPLFKCYNDKRRLCKRDCNLSCLPKTNLYSSAGDLSAAPADIPGSPNYNDASDPACQERLRRRVTVFKVGGTFLGDGDACASALLELMRAKLEGTSSVAETPKSPKRPNHRHRRTSGAPALARACSLSRALLSLARACSRLSRARLLAPARAGCALCCPGPFCAPCSDV